MQSIYEMMPECRSLRLDSKGYFKCLEHATISFNHRIANLDQQTSDIRSELLRCQEDSSKTWMVDCIFILVVVLFGIYCIVYFFYWLAHHEFIDTEMDRRRRDNMVGYTNRQIREIRVVVQSCMAKRDEKLRLERLAGKNWRESDYPIHNF